MAFQAFAQLSLAEPEVAFQCSSVLNAHTSTRAHTAFCLMSTGAIPPAGKRLDR
jgi:hypothetical protein